MSRRLTIPAALSLLALSACSTPPLKVECPRPEAPVVLMEPPPTLDLFPEKATLSDVASVVAGNYGKFHATAAQLESLQEWAQGVGRPADSQSFNPASKAEIPAAK